MNCDDKEILTTLLKGALYNLQTVKNVIECKEPEKVVIGVCLYGLGYIDAVCTLNSEFKEYRMLTRDEDDNDCQAFAVATKAFFDWMKQKDLIVEQVQ